MLIYYDSSHETEDTDVLAERGTIWNVPYQCTVRSPEEFIERIDFILESIKEEEWLPMALRGLILDGVMKLSYKYREGTLTLAEAQAGIGDMAIGCYFYNELTMKSKTLRHVRVLDMELSGDAELSSAYA